MQKEFFRREIITPERAKEILATNERICNKLNISIHYRSVRPHRVDFFSRQILDNLWKFNPDPLVLTGTPQAIGRTLNAQHRLHAVVKANKAIEMLVMYNADPSIMQSFSSTNRYRLPGDFIKASGNGDKMMQQL